MALVPLLRRWSSLPCSLAWSCWAGVRSAHPQALEDAVEVVARFDAPCPAQSQLVGAAGMRQEDDGRVVTLQLLRHLDCRAGGQLQLVQRTLGGRAEAAAGQPVVDLVDRRRGGGCERHEDELCTAGSTEPRNRTRGGQRVRQLG